MRERSIMIDIETKSTDKNAFVLSIGAVAFDDDGFLNSYEKARPEVFYAQVPWNDPSQSDRVIDASTLEWWEGQNKARRVLQAPDETESRFLYSGAEEMLTAFVEFTKAERSRNGYVIARPAAFDIAILCQSLRYYDIKQPWPYQSEKCMGGFLEACWRVGIGKTWRINVESHPNPIAHHAGDDAIWQTALWVHYNHELWKIAHRTAQAGFQFPDAPAGPVKPAVFRASQEPLRMLSTGSGDDIARLGPAPKLQEAP